MRPVLSYFVIFVFNIFVSSESMYIVEIEKKWIRWVLLCDILSVRYSIHLQGLIKVRYLIFQKLHNCGPANHRPNIPHTWSCSYTVKNVSFGKLSKLRMWIEKQILERRLTAWKVSKYGDFNVHIFLNSDWIQENTDQKSLRIWTLFAQC